MREGAISALRASRERHDAELRKLIANAVDAGARSQDIADALGLSRATLWRRYGDLLRRGEITTHERRKTSEDTVRELGRQADP